MVLIQPDILSSTGRVLEPSFLDTNTLQEVFELRLVLELGICQLLFLTKTSASLLKLGEMVSEEEHTENRLQKARLDADFHTVLYKMSGNRKIQRFQKMLETILTMGTMVPSKDLGKDPVTHRDLLLTLKDGTAAEFREKMAVHLQVYFATIEQ